MALRVFLAGGTGFLRRRDGRARTHPDPASAAVPDAPRWARVAAHAIPLTVLPSGIWRIAAVDFHAPLVNHSGDGATGPALGMPAWIYVVLLTVVSELVAFVGVGLVASWGEVVPFWVPRLGGRRVPVTTASVVAGAGASVLTVLWTSAWVSMLSGVTIRGDQLPASNPIRSSGWRLAIFVAAYLPLLLWGPLLAALALAYWRRRRPARPSSAPPVQDTSQETRCTAA